MTEWRWIEPFIEQLRRCELRAGEGVVILSESASRPQLVATARLAAQSLGAAVVDVIVPTPSNPHPVAIRSTGSCQALQANHVAVAALQAADMVIDCTVEGLLHAPETPAILDAGTRVLMISNEHPENFERYAIDETLAARVEDGAEWMRASERMHVTSEAGTDLTIALTGAFITGSSGLTNGPGSIAHWPGGLVVAFTAPHTVNGTLVLAPGDLNLTFKRYVERPVTLEVRDDHVVDIRGEGVDTMLFRSYLQAFPDRAARATSHVGWGMNSGARWDYFELYDKGDVNGTEARASAGNFLYSTGANEHAGRFTAGHFDLPMLGCTVTLDGEPVVVAGELVERLKPAAGGSEHASGERV